MLWGIGKDALAVLRANGPNRTSVVAAAAAVAVDVRHATRVEVQNVRAARVVRVERTRPVVPVRTCVAERRAVAPARSGEEYLVTVSGCTTYFLTTTNLFLILAAYQSGPCLMFAEVLAMLKKGNFIFL